MAKLNESLAKVAAAQGGKISNLKYPFRRVFPLCVGDDDDVKEDQKNAEYEFYQQTSPFYFTGQTKLQIPVQNVRDSVDGNAAVSISVAVEPTSVFCKVWHSEDRSTDVDNIQDEMDTLNLARAKGVPCPCLIPELSNLNISSSLSSLSGSYHVITMTEMSRDDVLPHDILNYAISLIRTCRKLHDDAGLLHCDIKPNNLSWDRNSRVVSLLDFGHAQFETNAKSYGGTVGYEAPEVEELKESHSRESDAFSVGRTLLKVCQEGSSGLDHLQGELELVRNVAEKLSMEDPSDRMKLVDGEDELSVYTSPSSSPPEKRRCIAPVAPNLCAP